MFAILSRRPARSTNNHTRPRLEVLEDRLALTGGLTFVNDNWNLIADNGDNVLSVGDRLRNDNDTINTGNRTVTYGVDGFGTVTTTSVGGISGIAGSVAAADSINDAIANTNIGGTVEILEGIYAQSVNVNKSLTVWGAQHGVDARTRSGAESKVTGVGNNGVTPFNVTANNVTLDGFTVEGATNVNQFGSGILLGAGTSGSEVRNNIIQDNIIGLHLANNSAINQTVIEQNLFRNNDAAGPSSGSGIYSDEFSAGGALTNVKIDSNAFVSHDGSGAAINLSSTSAGSQSNIAISRNTFDANSRALLAINLVNSSFTGNTVTNSNLADSADLRLFNGVTNFTITDNVLSGSGADLRALRITDLGVPGGPASGIVFNRNSVTGYGNANNIEIAAGAYTGTFDASLNYWGTTDPAAVQARILAIANPVDFSPILNNGESVANQSVVGFQADLSLVTVHTLGAQAGAVGRVQEGVNGTAVGGTVRLLSGTYTGDVNVNKAVTVIGSATLNGSVTSSAVGATISPGISGPGLLGTGNLDLGGNYVVQINGTAAGTGYDQINATGTVNVGGTLSTSLNFTSAVGDTFVIVKNDGTDAVNGTFANLGEGAIVGLNGQRFRISYQGGDGNDVTLTHVTTAPVLVNVTVTPNLLENGTATLTGMIGDPDPLDGHLLVIGWGDGTSDTVTLAPGTRSFTRTHVYRTDGNFQVLTLVVDNGGGAAATFSQTHVVNTDVFTVVRRTRRGSFIEVRDANTGALKFVLNPFPGFRGRLRVAALDVNGDKFPDLVVIRSTGKGAVARLFDGRTGAFLRNVELMPRSVNDPYSLSVEDFNHDGVKDLIVRGRLGRHTLVRIFRGSNLGQG